jgi:hypothetical protein
MKKSTILTKKKFRRSTGIKQQIFDKMLTLLHYQKHKVRG